MKRHHLHSFVLAFCLVGSVWLAWNVSAGSVAGSTPSLCVFKNFTGIPCPSCGATRSLSLLFSGDLPGGAAENPIGILLGLALTSFPLWILVDTIRKRETFFRFYRNLDRAFSTSRIFAFTGATLIAANWTWNILKGL